MVRLPLEPTSSLLPRNKSTNTIKFLCSYGGKIVPRYPDGKLRYLGGHTRVLAVDRFISFPELLLKMGELCGASVSFRCQLPTEDLDALVSIKSDEDLANLIEEYDRVASNFMKIRAFLSPIKSTTKISSSPPSSEYSTSSPSPKSLSPSSSFSATTTTASTPRCAPRPVRVTAAALPKSGGGSGGGMVAPPQSHYSCHHCYRNSSRIYLIHNGNHWQ